MQCIIPPHAHYNLYVVYDLWPLAKMRTIRKINKHNKNWSFVDFSLSFEIIWMIVFSYKLTKYTHVIFKNSYDSCFAQGYRLYSLILPRMRMFL